MTLSKVITVTSLIILVGVVVAPVKVVLAQAPPSQFNVTINELDENNEVDVNYIDYPKVTFKPTFNSNEYYYNFGYDYMLLEVNGYSKRVWRDVAQASSFDPNSAVWDLCAGGTGTPIGDGFYRVDDGFTAQLIGTYDDPFNVINEPTGEDYTLWTANFWVFGEYTCGNANSQTKKVELIYTKGADTSATFSISTNFTAADFSKYSVWLSHTTPDGGTTTTGAFYSASDKVTWDSSGSASGAHKFQVRSTASGLPEIDSQEFTVNIGAGGTQGNTNGNGGSGNTGGGGGGGGVGQGTGGTSDSINNLSNGALAKINFSVPTIGFLSGKTGTDLIKAAFVLILDYLLILASLTAVVVVVWNGINYGLSFGDSAKAEKAKKGLMYAVYGIVAILLCIVFISIVSRIVNTIK